MGLFKSLGKIVKGVTKPIKKVLKSPLGLTALAAFGLPAYARYAPQSWMGRGAHGILGPGSKMAKLGQYLYGSPESTSLLLSCLFIPKL